MVAGVCGGLAEYFNIDSTLVRALFVLLAFVGGLGLVAYIILALMVPSRSSQARNPLEVLRENVDDLAAGARDFGAGLTPEGDERAARRGFALGLVLTMLGLFILLGNLGILALLFRWLLPLVLLALGLLILWRGRRSG